MWFVRKWKAIIHILGPFKVAWRIMRRWRQHAFIDQIADFNRILSKTSSRGGYLTHFWVMFSFFTPWKHQKTRDFLMFSGGIERKRCPKKGLSVFYKKIALNISLNSLEDTCDSIFLKDSYCLTVFNFTQKRLFHWRFHAKLVTFFRTAPL